MGAENVEIVRAALDAWNHGDWDTALENVAPGIVFDNLRAQGEYRGIHRGLDQVRRLSDVFVEPWNKVHLEVDELIDAGDRVLSRQTASYLGRDGMKVETKTTWVWTLRGGSVTSIVHYEDHAEALEAVGL